MRSKQREIWFLRGLLFAASAALPVLMQLRPRKYGVLSYVINAGGNIVLDKWMISRKWITYPTRLLPQIFDIHILYDMLLYPTVTVLYTQWTWKDKPLQIFLKVFCLSAPLAIIEYWVERKTNLVKWHRGWTWYHTFLSVTVKSLFTRTVIQTIRKVVETREAAGNGRAASDRRALLKSKLL